MNKLNAKKQEKNIESLISSIKDDLEFISIRSGLKIKTYSEIFVEEGHSVVIATNGEKALEVLKRNKDIDAVISDYQMPIMDGLELKQKILGEYTLFPFFFLLPA